MAVHGGGEFKVTMNVNENTTFALAVFSVAYSMTAHGYLHLPIHFLQ